MLAFRQAEAGGVERGRGAQYRVRRHAELGRLQQRQLRDHQHRVTGIDALGLAPDRPDRAPIPALGAAVLDIVVDQREVVYELDGGSRGKSRPIVAADRVSRQQAEHGSDQLPGRRGDRQAFVSPAQVVFEHPAQDGGLGAQADRVPQFGLDLLGKRGRIEDFGRGRRSRVADAGGRAARALGPQREAGERREHVADDAIRAQAYDRTQLGLGAVLHEAVPDADPRELDGTSEATIRQKLGHRAAEPAGQDVLLDGDQPTHSCGQVAEEVGVQRLGEARVHHGSLDSQFGKPVSRGDGGSKRVADRDEGNVGTVPNRARARPMGSGWIVASGSGSRPIAAPRG